MPFALQLVKCFSRKVNRKNQISVLESHTKTANENYTSLRFNSIKPQFNQIIVASSIVNIIHCTMKMYGLLLSLTMFSNTIRIYVLHGDISSAVNVIHSKAFVVISVTSMLCRPQTTASNYPNVSARITHALLRNLVCITSWIICTVTMIASSFACLIHPLILQRC